MNWVVGSASCGRFATARSSFPRDESPPSSARTAPGRRHCSTCSSGCCHRRAVRRRSSARSPTTPRASWRGLGSSRKTRRCIATSRRRTTYAWESISTRPGTTTWLATDCSRPRSRSTVRHQRFPAVSAHNSRSRSRSARNRTCSSSTSRSRAWTRSPDGTSCSP